MNVFRIGLGNSVRVIIRDVHGPAHLARNVKGFE